jgi:LysR family transcriptional activator of nhaA
MSDWLNYHHLLYFWTVAKEGSLTGASKRLRLAQSTLSTQIKLLEEQLGVELFSRSGRKLELTERGRTAFDYADSIFALGNEMVSALRDETSSATCVTVGITQTISKPIVVRLLAPVLGDPNIQISCVEDRFAGLVDRLGRHEIDLILSDAPLGPDPDFKAFNHRLGSSAISFFAAPALAKQLRREFPRSLHDTRVLLPIEGSVIRRELDSWFAAEGITPRIVGQFGESALLESFGQRGLGVFAAPSVLEDEITVRDQVELIGQAPDIHANYYLINTERRVQHHGVATIVRAAKSQLRGHSH